MASTPRPFALAPPPAIFQQRRVDVLLSLQQAAQQIASILELDELLDTIVHRIAVDFGCIESSILLVDGDEFHLAAVHGCTQSKKGERWPVTEGLSAQVVATGMAYYAPDVTQELLYRACEPHTRSEVIIPLKVRGRIIGVFGASLMSAARGIVRSLAPLSSGPGEVLARVNQMLLGDFPTGRYVTMIYAVLDPARRTLTFASAGHPWPLLCHGTDVRPLHTDAGMPLGLLPGEFTEHTVKFCCDFRLLFYTDGISEALNRQDQEFGRSRLAEFVATHDCSVLRLMEAIGEFRGKCAQKDDATVILLRSA